MSFRLVAVFNYPPALGSKDFVLPVSSLGENFGFDFAVRLVHLAWRLSSTIRSSSGERFGSLGSKAS